MPIEEDTANTKEAEKPVENGKEITAENKQAGWSSYLLALRPWSFSASFIPVALGSCLTYKSLGTFNVWIFLVTCLTAISVHAAGNLVNTYFDFMKGVDSKKSDDRTLVDERLSPDAVATMGGALYLAGCAGFLILIVIAPVKMEHLALIYFGGLSSSFLYTGGLGLKYVALGDIIIFLTFGPVTVLFAYMSQGGALSWTPLYYAIPFALNTEAILHSNNTRDMKVDRDAGIVTLAILIGETGSYLLFALLIFTPYIMFVVLALHHTKVFLLPLITLFLAFKHEREFREKSLLKMPSKIATLNVEMGLLYVLAILLAPSGSLPGLS